MLINTLNKSNNHTPSGRGTSYEEVTSDITLLTNIVKLSDSKLLRVGYKLMKQDENTKKSKPLVSYVININISNSNTIISIADKNGDMKGYYTSGTLGFKGSQKTKKYTIITLLKNFIYNFNFLNNKSVLINFKGITKDQKIFVRKLKEKVSIKAINYDNLLPHNGCRPKKIRRK